ncbi:MAG: aldo/keto reductase [Planctomycetaceae bacterium]|nr:aldo/keto reductase [Planctomycetaceae bacterium]
MQPSRREFMATSAWGLAALGTGRLLEQSSQDAGSVLPTRGKSSGKPLPTNPPNTFGRYRTPYRFGLGGVAIGNGFAETSDAQAEAALEAAWEAGVRYYDTSPWYGLGVGEHRFGQFLHNHKGEDYVLSTKVGRLLKPTTDTPKNAGFVNPGPFSYQYDYSAEGTRRSIEDSLQRLGVEKIDIVFIHDLSPDNKDMGERWVDYFNAALQGAMPELSKMRKEGLIRGWGFGINTPDAALKSLDMADPDVCLMAAQYSILNHRDALDKTFPALQGRGVSVVVGSPFNAGYLTGRERYNYAGTIPPEAPVKRRRMTELAKEHGIDLRTAALQFCAAPDVVCAVIPGARNAEQVRANAASMQVVIPDEFWSALKREGMIAANAPVPKAT